MLWLGFNAVLQRHLQNYLMPMRLVAAVPHMKYSLSNCGISRRIIDQHGIDGFFYLPEWRVPSSNMAIDYKKND